MSGRKTESKTLSRRALLAGTAAAIGSTAMAARAQEQAPVEVPEDPTKVQADGASALGERSSFETPERTVLGANGSYTPLQKLEGIITPSDLHFERHHAGVPVIDPERYSLLIHGMVDRPTVFTLAELKKFPAESMIRFLECSGNGFRDYKPGDSKGERTVQQTDGLTSTSEWIGVPLKTLFKEVGISKDAKWFLAESMDAAAMTRSIPTDKGWDDALVAYGQNGEALRPPQGYPVRLFLPGYEGSSNVKWLRRIEVSDRPFGSREETSKYTDPLPDGKARQFSFVMDAKSVITHPTYPTELNEPGWVEIKGIAWSGRGKIARVDVSTDGGETWQKATLADPVLPKCHTRFRSMWKWSGGNATIMSRATDETGYSQPTLAELRRVRGEYTTYHYNQVRAWRVLPDGTILFGEEEA